MTSRSFWLLLLVPVMLFCFTGCKEKEVTNFVADNGRNYAEITKDGHTYQVLTEMREAYKAVCIFDEHNNLQWFKISFADSMKQQTGLVCEIRKPNNESLPGIKMTEREFVSGISSEAEGFEQWKNQYLDFVQTGGTMSRYVLVDSTDRSKGGKDQVLAKPVSSGIKDVFCQCKAGRIVGHCMVSALRCAMNSLCQVMDCVESGEWSAECSENLQRARVCIGEYQQ